MRTSPRTPSVVAVVLLGSLLLAGCSAAGGGVATSEAADGRGRADTAAGPADQAAGATGLRVTSSAPDDGREVITTGDLTLVATDPRAAVRSIIELVETAGGRVESRSERGHDVDPERTSGELTVRIPADRVTTTVDALESLGEVQDVSLDAQDVTATAIDLDARIQALGASVSRLQVLMAEAATTADLLAAEKELTTRQAELESLQSQRSSITDQVDMSTLTIQVLPQAPGTVRTAGFLGGLSAGWGALLVALGALVVAVGALLPWLAAATIVLVGTRILLHLLRSRRRDAALSGSSGAPSSERPDGQSAGPREDTTLVESGDPHA